MEELSIVMVQLSLLSDCQKIYISTQRTIGITNFHCVELFHHCIPFFWAIIYFQKLKSKTKQTLELQAPLPCFDQVTSVKTYLEQMTKKCSDIEIHYQQNFKSRGDAHLLKLMNTVETAVDQLFYCQSSAKALKKSNILF